VAQSRIPEISIDGAQKFLEKANPVIPSEVEESRSEMKDYATGSFDSAPLRSG
jgi:hypothetical protein